MYVQYTYAEFCTFFIALGQIILFLENRQGSILYYKMYLVF